MAKQFQSKALRALGLSAASSLMPKEVVKNVTTHNSLVFSDYKVFWREAIAKSTVTTKFFSEVVLKIVDIEKHLRNPKSVLNYDVERVLRIGS